MREFANVIWAISFFLFPVGVGLFLAGRARDDTRRAQRRAWKTTPGVFHKNLRVLTWSFIMLCVCAVGGVFFCFDEAPGRSSSRASSLARRGASNSDCSSWSCARWRSVAGGAGAEGVERTEGWANGRR